jgi:hypothetical protein
MAVTSRSRVVGLIAKPIAPSSRATWLRSIAETTCTGMWRVSGLRFRRSSTLRPDTSGRPISSRMPFGRSSLARQRFFGRTRHHAVEVQFMGQGHQCFGERGVVLDRQDQAPGALAAAAVIGHAGRSGRAPTVQARTGAGGSIGRAAARRH